MMLLTRTEMFDLLADNLAIIEVDEKSGSINWATRTLELMFGYTVPGDLEGCRVEVLMPSDLREKHANIHRPFYSLDPRARLMGTKVKLSGQRKDGTVFPVEVMLLPKSTNRIRVIIGVITDLTDNVYINRNRGEKT